MKEALCEAHVSPFFFLWQLGQGGLDGDCVLRDWSDREPLGRLRALGMTVLTARRVGRCSFCTPCHGAIKPGDRISPHPAQGGEWVHYYHLRGEAARAEDSKQQKLF